VFVILQNNPKQELTVALNSVSVSMLLASLLRSTNATFLTDCSWLL